MARKANKRTDFLTPKINFSAAGFLNRSGSEPKMVNSHLAQSREVFNLGVNRMKTKKVCLRCKELLPLSSFYVYPPNTSKAGFVVNKCKSCEKIRKLEQHNLQPWKAYSRFIKRRCSAFGKREGKNYADKGIKKLITSEELRVLWFRDKAYMLIKPSVDRINNSGHYEFSNCRFIEAKDNSRKGNR